MVCLFGLLGTVVSPAKMANLINMLEGLTFVGPKEPHIKRGRGVHIGATWRMLLNDLCLWHCDFMWIHLISIHAFALSDPYCLPDESASLVCFSSIALTLFQSIGRSSSQT